MKTSKDLRAIAVEHEAAAQDLREQAARLDRDALAANSLEDRLVYAAYDRCPCGAGLACDPCYEDTSSPFAGPLSGFWDCSAILLGTAATDVKHTDKLPFAFYGVKSELQPSARGATTRPVTATTTTA